MFDQLKRINARPEPFEFYTAKDLWTDEHTSKQMLEYHLNEVVDLASRNKGFIERSVEWIVSHFQVSNNTEIADFGCGPGLYANRLAETGATVTGIDFSKNSLRYARKAAAEKGLKVEYVHGNYLDFETGNRFDLIIMIMCDFCVLSPQQRNKLLRKFASLLKPGGSVLLDVNSLNRFEKRQEWATYELNQLNGFWSPEDYYCFLNTFKYEKEKVALDKYTIIEASRQRDVYNWFQYFSPETLEREFADSGLAVKEIFSDVAGAPFDPTTEEFAVVAGKL